MSHVRRLARSLYSRLFVLAMRVVAPRTEELCPKRLRARLGGHDTLHIVAPGASVSRNEDSLESLTGADILGVNYFITCSDVPLWAKARLFVIEPHETYLAYSRALASAAAAKESCLVMVKGTGSPAKVVASVRLVRELASIPGATVLLARDVYAADLRQSSRADAIMDHPHNTVSGFKTLLWTLSFAFVAGYREIILHGFDFSHDYAYAKLLQEDDTRILPNTWVADEAIRSSVLDDLVRLHKLFAERGIRLAQSGCDGPLATILPAHSTAAPSPGGRS